MKNNMILTKVGENKNYTITIDTKKEMLVIETSALMKKTLKKSSIEDVQTMICEWESEFIKKDKSVIGRAIIGGVLFGGAGAVVGGMTGLKPEEKEVNKRVVLYIEFANGDTFEGVFIPPALDKYETTMNIFKNSFDKIKNKQTFTK